MCAKSHLYTELAQWREHLATNQGFVGVRVPYSVPIFTDSRRVRFAIFFSYLRHLYTTDKSV